MSCPGPTRDSSSSSDLPTPFGDLHGSARRKFVQISSISKRHGMKSLGATTNIHAGNDY
jgi:hypothetical protein